ncbi:MAG: hypothetical protein KDD89_03805, partial [Anaerolineales bacterium]|nr:hypothetical protein [Anaerolineales bacterium]
MIPAIDSVTPRDFSRGFLPAQDPLLHLPAPFEPWEEVGQWLPKLLLSENIRPIMRGLPPFPLEAIETEPQKWRAMTLLAYLTSGYVLGYEHTPAKVRPAHLAVPLVTMADELGIPPILSYALQTMYNWRRIIDAGPTAVGNLGLIQNFLGGMDEEWFVTIHVNIEAEAGRALRVLEPLHTAGDKHDIPLAEHCLHEIAATLTTLRHLLSRMVERCDPYIYYHRVRPFMFGWKDNPDLPGGLIYEGVEKFGGQPQAFRGETGAQSGIIPAIDAALGIQHERDAMRIYLNEMRDYMPPADRAFVAALEAGPSVRAWVMREKAAHPSLREA